VGFSYGYFWWFGLTRTLLLFMLCSSLSGDNRCWCNHRAAHGEWCSVQLIPTDLAALRRHWRGRIEQVYQMRSIDFLCDGVLLALVAAKYTTRLSPDATAYLHRRLCVRRWEEALRCQLAIYRSLDSIVSGWDCACRARIVRVQPATQALRTVSLDGHPSLSYERPAPRRVPSECELIKYVGHTLCGPCDDYRFRQHASFMTGAVTLPLTRL